MDGQGDSSAEDGSRQGGGAGRHVSWLEIVASAFGLLLTLGMLAFIGWEAVSRADGEPPAITVEARQVSALRSGAGWVVEFVAVNRAPATAANVEIEGVLRRGDRDVATSRTVLDFVPGGSSRRGGLFFPTDPAGYELDLRALGYVEP